MKKIVFLHFMILFSGKIFAASSPSKAQYKAAILYSHSTGSEYICVISETLKQYSDRLSISSHVFDYENDMNKLAEQVKKIKNETFNVVFGPRISGEATLVANILDKENIPVIPIGSSLDSVTRDYQNTFRMVGDAKQNSLKFASFIQKRIKAKKILIVTNLSIPYSTEYRDLMTKNLADADITYFNYINGETNFQSVTDIVRKNNIDLVYAPIYDLDLAELYKQLSMTELKTTILTHAGLYNATDLMTSISSGNIKLLYNGLRDSNYNVSQYQVFKKITKSCNIDHKNVRAALAFETANIVAESLLSDEFKKHSNLTMAIKKLKYRGLLGRWQLDEYRNPDRPLHIYQFTSTGSKHFYTVNQETL